MKVNLKLLGDNAFIPSSQRDEELIEKLAKNAIYAVEIKNLDSYSSLQNRALHLWFSQIAESFNDLNIPISALHKPTTKWNGEMFKEMFYRPVLTTIIGKKSTTQLEKQELQLLIESLIRGFAYKGIELPEFPNREMIGG